MTGNNKGHVIDNAGNGCLKNVSLLREDFNLDYGIEFEVFKANKRWYKCKSKSSNKEKVADEGDEISVIYTTAPVSEKTFAWLRVKSQVAARDNVLWCRSKSEIAEYCEPNGHKVETFNVSRFGLFGSKDIREECFFIELGRRKESRPSTEKVGVWISSKYYNEQMLPRVHNLSPEALGDKREEGQQVQQAVQPVQDAKAYQVQPAQLFQPPQMPPYLYNPMTCLNCMYSLPEIAMSQQFPMGNMSMAMNPMEMFMNSMGMPMNMGMNMPMNSMNFPMQQPMMGMSADAQNDQALHDDGSIDVTDSTQRLDGDAAYTFGTESNGPFNY